MPIKLTSLKDLKVMRVKAMKVTPPTPPKRPTTRPWLADYIKYLVWREKRRSAMMHAHI